MIDKIKTFVKSLFTDGDWDADLTKVGGLAIIIAGMVGFFLSLPEWSIMMGIGAGMATSGKFSTKG